MVAPQNNLSSGRGSITVSDLIQQAAQDNNNVAVPVSSAIPAATLMAMFAGVSPAVPTSNAANGHRNSVVQSFTSSAL
jgi:hypothetical protein